MKKQKKSNKFPMEIINLILDFSGIRCKTCLKKISIINSSDFFSMPVNNKNSKPYCSILCYNHI